MKEYYLEVALWQPNDFWNSWRVIKKNFIVIRFNDDNYMYVKDSQLTLLPIKKIKAGEITPVENMRVSKMAYSTARVYMSKAMEHKMKVEQKDFMISVIHLVTRSERGKHSGSNSTTREFSRTHDQDVRELRNRHGESWCRACNADGTIRGYPV